MAYFVRLLVCEVDFAHLNCDQMRWHSLPAN